MAKRITESELTDWMKRHGPRLINLSAGICRDRHRAEEVVQEAFVKLWKSPPDAGEIAYASWLRRVVTNLSINALQRTKRPSALPEHSTDPAMHMRDRSSEREEAQEDLGRVRQAMDQLDEPKRVILMLRACEGLTYEQIAEHLGVPVGTVMSRLNRARTALMAELKTSDEENQPDVFEFRKYKQA